MKRLMQCLNSNIWVYRLIEHPKEKFHSVRLAGIRIMKLENQFVERHMLRLGIEGEEYFQRKDAEAAEATSEPDDDRGGQ